MLTSTLVVASASPPSITSLRATVDHLESVLANEEQVSEALAQNYDSLQGRLQVLDASLRRTHNQLHATRIEVSATAKELQSDAVLAYVFGTENASSVSLFTQDANQSVAAGVYQQTVVGNVAGLETSYKNETETLSSQERNLSAQRSAVAAVSRHAGVLLDENHRIAVHTNALVRSMGAQLHHLVLEAAIAAARAAAAARQQEAAAGAAGVAGQLGGTQSVDQALQGFSGEINGTATGNAAGMRAFAAAKTQIGVPYVWGGETPGVGFDCSGLTQWSWAQAGVSIPRTAAEQWAALPHVSLTSLQPGDLLFYFNLDGDDQVDHVVMYGGSGPWGTQTTIAADYTGTTIALQPAFTYGLIGAAQP